MSSDPKSRPIPLRVANGTAYVWDVDDIASLRSKHHVCGVLTGTLPHLSQQNVFLGVPLVLMPEEVVLLVGIGAAILIDDPTAHLQPTVPQLTKWSKEQQNLIKTQAAYVETKTLKENAKPGRAMSEEALRKRKEREEKRKKSSATASAHESRAHDADVEDEDGDDEPGPLMLSSGSTVTPAKASKRKEAAAAAEKVKINLPTIFSPPSSASSSSISTPVPSSTPYTITIPASSSTLEWYSPKQSSSIYSTLSSAKEAGIWTYPSTPAERARCGIFKDLWKQGYFMGGGIKFGGEYLVYPGDPLRYHSHFTATVIESPIASLRPMEIVAHGRLGTATKKSHLLCGWDDNKQEASYLSIEWAGFG